MLLLPKPFTTNDPKAVVRETLKQEKMTEQLGSILIVDDEEVKEYWQ